MAPLGVSQDVNDAQIAALLPETGYVLTVAEIPNGAGGRSVKETKGASIPCGLAPLKGGEYVGARAMPKPAGERLDARTTHVITLHSGVAVAEKDRIEIAGRGVFEVTALRRRSLEILREVEAREAP